LNRAQLIQAIQEKQSFLCIGLDTDLEKLPAAFDKTPQGALAFNKAIIDATLPYAVAYKINTAFFEAMGWQGWQVMQETFNYLPANVFKIADAKRGDIGNTSTQYARAFFNRMNADAITLVPYMGNDSIEPFFKFNNKWGIVLALTSNPGSADYEQQVINQHQLFELVIKNTCTIATPNNLMFVAGATKPQLFLTIRQHAPNHFLLVPGVGAQGGSLQEVFKYGKTADVGLLVNASRSIIYASNGTDFAHAAAKEAANMQQQMQQLLQL
jgi:orotidine-5'-phosphate decarboxylase